MFYREPHRRLFRAMVALTERRVVIDHVTLRDELLRRTAASDKVSMGQSSKRMVP